MRKDYHMHPTVLKTPERFELFVKEALRKNIGEICVTDHMPLSLSHAKDRLERGRVRDYCARVRELAEAYADCISIKCGIEIDYHPSVRSEIEEVLGEGSFDFILGSSHIHIFEKENCARYTYNDFAALALENSIRAAESGWFDALSHPDMFRFTFERPDRFPLIVEEYTPARHRALWDALFAAVNKSGAYLEINPHLAEDKRDLFYTYPQDSVVEWALEAGVKFSFGSDAHKPESVGAYLDELEVHPVYGGALAAWESGNETR